MNILRSKLGERNPNPELDGLPVLYNPRNFEIFRSWTAIWTAIWTFMDCHLDAPSSFLQGPASFSNLADFMVEFWSDSFS